MITTFTSARTVQTIAALLLSTAFFASTVLPAHAATDANQIAHMEGQLDEAALSLAQLLAVTPKGEVLGATATSVELQAQIDALMAQVAAGGGSAGTATELQAQIELLMAQIAALNGGATTKSVPVRPVCRVTLDKASYKFGDTIKLSWSSTGAASARFVDTLLGKDGMVMPTSPRLNGTASLKATIQGNQIVTLEVKSKTGHTSTCTKVVGVAGSTKMDARTAPLQAQVIASGIEINKLNALREAIDTKINTLQVKVDTLQAKIYEILAQTGTGSTTNEKSFFELTSSTETLLVNTDSITTDDAGKFDLKFEATAVDTDVVVPAKAARAGNTTEGVLYQVIDVATGQPAKKGTYTASLFSSAERVGTTYVVKEGESEQFTVTVVFDPSVTGSYKVQLQSIVTSTSGPKYTLKPATNFSSAALLITN